MDGEREREKDKDRERERARRINRGMEGIATEETRERAKDEPYTYIPLGGRSTCEREKREDTRRKKERVWW